MPKIVFDSKVSQLKSQLCSSLVNARRPSVRNDFMRVWNILRVNLLIGTFVFAWVFRAIDAQPTTPPLSPVSIFGYQAKVEPESHYKLHGVVRSIRLEEATVVIKHGPIPDLMPTPMTMEYHAVKAEELKGLKPGDTVEGDVFEREGEYWIDRLSVVKDKR